MASEKIETVFTAKDQASPVVSKLKTNIAKLGGPKTGPLGSMGAGLLTSAAAGLGAAAAFGALTSGLQSAGEFMGASVVKAMEDEKSIRSLTTALEANVPAWDGSMAAIDRVTQAGINLGFADDDTRAGIQKLVIANGNLTTSLDLVQLAFDVARGKGVDLATATDIVNKASIGNSKALKQMGIDLGKAATSTELLGALNERFAGQAESYTTTLAGESEVVAMQFDEMQESFGYGVMPVFKDGMDYIKNTFIPGLQNLGDMVANVFNPPQRNSIVGQEMHTLADDWKDAGKTLDASFAGGVTSHDDLIAHAAEEALKNGIRQAAFANKTIWEHSARALTGDLAGALQDGAKTDIKDAMDKVTWAIKHPMALARQIAQIEGALTTLEYKRGLASNSEEVNNVIDQQINALIGDWENLTGKAFDRGAAATDQYQRGLNSGPNPHMPPIDYYKSDRFTNPNRRASGGPVGAGETYLVGEQGPELLHMGGRNGNITPNHQLGGGTIVVNIDGRELFRIMDARMGKALAMSGSGGYTRS